MIMYAASAAHYVIITASLLFNIKDPETVSKLISAFLTPYSPACGVEDQDVNELLRYSAPDCIQSVLLLINVSRVTLNFISDR
jgi:hypothetical protein